MKRKTAKEILAESFRELAENKNIDTVGILLQLFTDSFQTNTILSPGITLKRLNLSLQM